ncbi:MAG: hypothetical protein WAV55_01930 [Clostridiaceae bacterium]
MTFSPVTIQVEKVWKGSYFKEFEKISLFVYGGYLPYREMEKSFHPDDVKAQQTKRTLSEAEKNPPGILMIWMAGLPGSRKKIRSSYPSR